MVGELFGALFVGFLLLWGIKTLSKGTFVRTGLPKRPERQGKSPSSAQPRILYHGTKLETALEIYKSGLWMVGQSRPRAIWMGDNFEKARAHAGRKGGIVIIRVHPDLRLTKGSRGVYLFKIPNASPYEEYYQVQGLTPVGVLDSDGKTIR